MPSLDSETEQSDGHQAADQPHLILETLVAAAGSSVVFWHGVTYRARAQCNGARARNRNGTIMTEPFFDHDRLDVYRLSIEYVANAFDSSRSLEGLHRHARDQWLRAAQSIPLNIAEGNGKLSLKDRARFLDIARGSALECASIQDVRVVSGGMNRKTDHDLKSKLVRIVAMLTRMAMKFDGVAETLSEYNQSGEH